MKTKVLVCLTLVGVVFSLILSGPTLAGPKEDKTMPTNPVKMKASQSTKVTIQPGSFLTTGGRNGCHKKIMVYYVKDQNQKVIHHGAAEPQKNFSENIVVEPGEYEVFYSFSGQIAEKEEGGVVLFSRPLTQINTPIAFERVRTALNN